MLVQLGAVAAGVFAGLTSAQYVIQPNSVPLSTRTAWCDSQITQCPLICLQYPGTSGAQVNDCDAEKLSYECLCSNGIVPNASEYSLTLPYYVCTAWGTQCVSGCGQDNACADSCRVNHPCGAQNPTQVNTTTASTMDQTTSSSATVTPFGAAAASATQKGAAAIYTASYTHVGNAFGYLMLGAAFAGGMAFAL